MPFSEDFEYFDSDDYKSFESDDFESFVPEDFDHLSEERTITFFFYNAVLLFSSLIIGKDFFFIND